MNHNTLFYVDYSSLEVSHSFISHTDLIHIGHPISTTNNNSFTMKQTFKLKFYNCRQSYSRENNLLNFISIQEETKINIVEKTCEDTINIQNNPIKTPQNSYEKTYKEDIQMTFYRSYEESSLEMTNLP